MKNILDKIKESFSLRLILYILSVAAIVFLVAFAINIKSAREYVKKESFKRAEVTLESTVFQIDNVLTSVETAVRNLSWLVVENIDNPDYMYTITERLLMSNPYVFGSAIAFDPYYYSKKGMYWSPFSYRENGRIESKQLGTIDYDYHYMDWYQIPKLLGKPYWSEPYLDEGGADVVMSTFSYPLYDSEGNLFGIFTADISLQWFAHKVETMKLYPNSHNIMIGRGGTYLVHPDKHYILNESIFASALYDENDQLLETAHKMVKGERGMVELKRGDENYYLFFAPVTSIGWSLAVACTHSDILAALDNMTIIIIIIGILGIIIMAVCCYFTIKRLTQPLSSFAESARDIAKGTFDASLPDISSKDEMRTLRDSFQYMQESLVTYISELQETTANNERIESELRIARNIQMGMVPKTFPPFPGRNDLDLYSLLKPAKEVGGDLYDYFIKDEKLYFIVGDVSGKGIPASLVMAVICRLFRIMAIHTETPEKIVESLNDTLAENNESNMFCTAFVGILDLSSGELKYCNAGHNSPIITGACEECAYLDVIPNLPLGLFEGFLYEPQSCTIENGTTLFLYTDGVTEAESVNQELYSEERLIEMLKLKGKNESRAIVDFIVSDIEKHSNGAQQSDDITIVCLNYKKML